MARRANRPFAAMRRGSALLLAIAPFWCSPLASQDAPAPSPTPAPAPAPADREPDPPGTIVVIGDRAIIASLRNFAVEQTYGEDDVASYAAGSVGEVLDAIREENGDENPAFLVNGRPVADASDIADLPPEAIQRIETLPRGAAQRVNGAAGQRAYNVVLKRQLRTAVVTASDEVATDGGWSSLRGALQLTHIQGQNRLNLSLTGADSGVLLESERPYVPRTEDTYYAAGGNVLPAFGMSQVSPALTALAGAPVTSVALPPGLAAPTLAALLPGANALNPSGRGDFRSLRGASRPINLSLSGNRQLDDMFSLSFNANATWSDSRSLGGLPRARITIPAANPFSPFGVPVSLYLENPDGLLVSRSKSNSQGVSVTLNALVGKWRGSLNGRYDRRVSHSAYEYSGQLPALSNADNPFDGTLAARIPVIANRSDSASRSTAVAAEASGPLADLWAGPIEARVSASVRWETFEGASTTGGAQSLDQRQVSAGGGLSLPLTSSEKGVLGALGDSDLAFDIGYVDLGEFGSLMRSSLALNWQVADWLRLVARTTRDESAISPFLLAAPATIVEDVAYFDPVTGQTVDVTTIYGGVAGLLPEDRRTRSIAVTATPWKAYNLQLDAEYSVDDLRNQIGALPEPTPAVLAAFPGRFVRDSSGTLVLVDNRSINLARERSERLRLGVRYAVPLSPPPRRVAASGGRPAYRTKQTRLQVTLSHTELLSNTSVIRPGLPVIDLLDGAAVGFGGAQPRGTTSANFALTHGASGMRMDFRRRGPSKLLYGSLANPQLLDFGSLTTLDARLYTDLGDHFGQSKLAKGARMTLVIDNVFNRRQSVTDPDGFAPQAYQKIRRDALGRTVQLELRKSF
ncbi:hypothetical protein N0B51_13705 [Tsuneonella sp. YG55]|uniref:TonB-dependent receptor n=1 Tax=Tsuneonella litorea TaxID=2976475 RepID=A0A9X2W4E4_9SPHN|nr:hypothetical protein [Tsuneonella litorea]MCT2560034.1 hypothetical protein [Tsuneonella litorea]